MPLYGHPAAPVVEVYSMLSTRVLEIVRRVYLGHTTTTQEKGLDVRTDSHHPAILDGDDIVHDEEEQDA